MTFLQQKDIYYILDVVHVGKLIKSNTIHNFAEMNGIGNISLIS